MCLKSARERNDLDRQWNQKCMWNYARVSYDLHGPTEERKLLLEELLAIQIRLYGVYAPQTKETESLFM